MDVRGSPLIGRKQEQRTLSGLIDGARQGRSGVLVVRGDAGVGKTALLAAAVDEAADCRVIRVSGAEAEMELAYAAVQQLCAPLLSTLHRLPVPQADALRVALGLATGHTPDRLLVGLAVLTLLSTAGGERPTICVVDDAQWIDVESLQTLAFVARRILADPVVMLFAARESGARRELDGQPELMLRGLDEQHARALLASIMPGRLNDMVRENILAEAAGNPLALLELHTALTPEEMAGGYGLARARSTATRLEQTFIERLTALPAPTAQLLLVAAAEPAGRPEWLWASASRLGIDIAAAEPAETSGLITRDGGIRFRHPLIRATIYRYASRAERRRVHAALAQVITGPAADDYRAWHRAHAAEGPDEQVATELEESAQRAKARGGVAATAAFLAEAVKLTPDPTRRARRALDAAQAKFEAGAPEAATQLVLTAQDLTDDDIVIARGQLLRARMAFAASRGTDAPPLLLAAAEQLSKLDPALARETYLEAVTAAILVGRSSTDERYSAPAVAAAARSAPPAPDPPRAVDALLDGLVLRFTDGYAAAAPVLHEAILRFVHDAESLTADGRWHEISHRVCLDIFDQDSYEVLCGRQLEVLRAAGAMTLLPVAMITSAALAVTSGRFDRAAALFEESAAIIAATGGAVPASVQSYLAAYRGQEQLCLEGVREAREAATVRGEGYTVAVVRYAEAILYNGLGRFPEALAAAESGAGYDDVGMCGYLLTELVEAAARSGADAVAAEACRRLTERAQASGTDTALGVAARSRALLAHGPEADAAYREALECLGRSPVVVYVARTHLVYGEFLRRAKRRTEAQTQLRVAFEMFTEMGAEGFAERAARELRVTGEMVHARSANRPAGLTAQEHHIARLARDGFTNPEIAGRLFISPRTVEWHLGKIFAKLGVASRRDLRTAEVLHEPND